MKIRRIAQGKSDPEQHLYEAIAAIKTVDEAQKFIRDLCTPAEIQAMADRWRVVQPIKQGKAYRQIYDETGVSVTTIGRVARSLTFGEDGYNIIYKRLEKQSNEYDVKTTRKTKRIRNK